MAFGSPVSDLTRISPRTPCGAPNTPIEDEAVGRTAPAGSSGLQAAGASAALAAAASAAAARSCAFFFGLAF